MKLTLASKEGVNFLTISGTVDAHNFSILKAGVTKLFRDGKNRIVLQFLNADQFESDVIREIAILDILAREMSGRIAIIVGVPDVKSRLISFSKPPVVPVFETEEQVLEFFRQPPKEDSEAVPGEEKVNKLELLAKDKEIAALKEQLKQLDPRETQKAREEAAAAKGQYSELLKQHNALLLDRREPFSDEVAKAKIAALEGEIKELTERVKGLTKGA